MRVQTFKRAKIQYALCMSEPDYIQCDCGHCWTVQGISLIGGTVTCPNCRATEYLPERSHYE